VGYHRREAGAPPAEIRTPHIDTLVADGVEQGSAGRGGQGGSDPLEASPDTP
jgi:hypothetical protein